MNSSVDPIKILVLRFGSLGDLVLLLPLLKNLRLAFPDGEIHLACKSRYAGLFEGSSSIDRIHTLAGGGFGELLKLWKDLRGEHFDIIMDTHNVIRSTILYLSLSAPSKIRLRKEQIRKGLLIRGKRNLYERIVHQSERYLDCARRMGIEAREITPSLDIPDSVGRRAREFLLSAGISGTPLVAVAPGARWETKRWPAELFARTVSMLSGGGMGVVLIGGEDDAAIARDIAASVHPHPPNAAGTLSLLETAALLRECRLLITNDSAPLHLAEAVGTPVVALFGPTVREFGYFPTLPDSVVLETDLPCRPCSRNGVRPCPPGTKECLTSITVEQVIEAVRGIVATSARAAGRENETERIPE